MGDKVLAVVGVILWLVIVVGGLICAGSGCAMIQRVSDAIFNPEPKPTIVPETSQVQLWQTIKGLTPNWLAIPVIALGAVAMFNGAAKLGMSCIIFGSVNLFMALATSRFGFYMAVCGLVGSMAAVAASILAKNKALKEIVFGVQKVKEGFREDDNGAPIAVRITTAQSNIQTKSTKKIVAKIKTKARLKGEI